MSVIYMDNAATSWPKPAETMAAINHYNDMIGGSPGRSGHRLSVDAGRCVIDAREALAELFGISNPLRIVFTGNATEALNIAIFGFLAAGDHVITSGMEHNSVMRPLRALEQQGVDVTVIPCSPRGEIDPGDVEKAIGAATRAIYLTHASNVTGTIMPIADVGAIAREKGIMFCVDAAQSAGAVPLDVEDMKIDFLAFTGHKSLFGPQGTGGFYVADGFAKNIRPIMMGGTGSRSESEEHPDFLPDKFEPGTVNGIGIAGLGAGVRFILDRGVDHIRNHEMGLTDMLILGLGEIPGVVVHGGRDARRQTTAVSFSIETVSPAAIALILDEEYQIMSRPGLQCAPAAHRTIGTFPVGTVRLSPGYFTSEDDIGRALSAIAAIAGRIVRL
ncbi:MAG: aminotransferase class V-fold PLP-dependent enzyme [Deltaproteobacteria bacterium]|nr:aminotransferase class V-fold PLP-dependent enzyme [Deltaproteobacteria bacterium]